MQEQRPPFSSDSKLSVVLSGISPSFDGLSQSPGQVIHVLLTRAPVYSPSCPDFLPRLACLRHAASVRSEPGSNSPKRLIISIGPCRLIGTDRQTDRYSNRKSDSRRLFRSPLPIIRHALLFSFQRPAPLRGELLKVTLDEADVNRNQFGSKKLLTYRSFPSVNRTISAPTTGTLERRDSNCAAAGR